MTGAPLPNGADAVVMVEYTEEETGIVKVKRSVNQGENVRLRRTGDKERRNCP